MKRLANFKKSLILDSDSTEHFKSKNFLVIAKKQMNITHTPSNRIIQVIMILIGLFASMK